MTVEATLLLPLIFLIIVFLIFTGFYMYDQCVMQQDIFRAMIRTQQIKWVSDKEISNKFLQMEDDWYYDKYVSFMKSPKTLAITNDSFEITQEAKIKVINLIPFNIEKNEWLIKKSATGERRDVVRILRDLRLVEGK